MGLAVLLELILMGLKLAVVCYYIIFSCSNSCCVFCNKTPTIFVADRRGRKKRMKTSTQQSITSTSKDVLLQDKIKVFLFLFFSLFKSTFLVCNFQFIFFLYQIYDYAHGHTSSKAHLKLTHKESKLNCNQYHGMVL